MPSPAAWAARVATISARLGADLLSGRTHLCPQCRRDLSENVLSHVYGCTVMPDEVRQRAEALRQVAQRLVKESRQVRDNADVLIRQAEAAVEESRRALWQALKATRPGHMTRGTGQGPAQRGIRARRRFVRVLLYAARFSSAGGLSRSGSRPR